MPLLLQDPAARGLLIGAAAMIVVGEVGATYVGQARDGHRRVLGSVAEAILAVRRRAETPSQDRATKWIIVVCTRLGLLAAFAIAALAPGLRIYANSWWTLALALVLVLAGAGLRAWAIVTLGRFFRREVTIEPGQRLVRSGPYRVLRHPSYAGLLLSFAGLGLAFGSWVSAFAALVVSLLGLLPRIRVEEDALAQAFGPLYAEYAASRARILPHVW